jgi:hypothetical protein
VNPEVDPREAEARFVESVQGKIKSTSTVGALTLCLHMVFDGTTVGFRSAAVSRNAAPVLGLRRAVMK